MLNLPEVSLVLIETRQHDLAQLALADCEARVNFGDVLVFTDRPADFAGRGRRIFEVPDWPNKMGWSRHFWQEVAPHMGTSHALGIQWDSWVVDVEMWRPKFLEYDYVGAPWWYKDGMNVGNGGFCLRSTTLMRFLRRHRAKYPCITDLDDDLLCRKYRTSLEGEGFLWAPEDLAIDFAFETTRPDPNGRHFGFHAAYNFDYGCQGDEERLLERARLMAQSGYATETNKYIWEGFAKRCPEIAARVRETFNGRDHGEKHPSGA
jgi:hypothetical protein